MLSVVKEWSVWAPHREWPKERAERYYACANSSAPILWTTSPSDEWLHGYFLSDVTGKALYDIFPLFVRFPKPWENMSDDKVQKKQNDIQDSA